jgi:hypothetical protein
VPLLSETTLAASMIPLSCESAEWSIGPRPNCARKKWLIEFGPMIAEKAEKLNGEAIGRHWPMPNCVTSSARRPANS